MNALKDQNDLKDDAKCFACLKKQKSHKWIQQAYLSPSRQMVSLRCAAAGGSSAAHSGQMPSHSSGSHTDMASLLQTDTNRFKNGILNRKWDD